MQITASDRIPASTAVDATATLRRIGSTDQGNEIFAGRVLRTNVTDVAATGRELFREYTQMPLRQNHAGLVGFLRNGDAWDAVELLAALPGATPERAWLPGVITTMPSLQLDAVWLLADYGGDYSGMLLPADRQPR